MGRKLFLVTNQLIRAHRLRRLTDTTQTPLSGLTMVVQADSVFQTSKVSVQLKIYLVAEGSGETAFHLLVLQTFIQQTLKASNGLLN